MKRCITCSVVALLASITSLAYGQAEEGEEGCDIPAFECSNIPYLPPGQTWVPSSYDWTPNRLPAAWINLRPGGSYYCSLTEGGNYRGLQDWWYDQDDDPEYDGAGTLVFTNLETRLTHAYNAGFRRIILNLPAGMVRNQNMASAQWWSMPQWKREGLACVIQNWLASKPDTQFEVYGAFQINDHGSLCMSDNNAYTEPTIQAGAGCVSEGDPTEGWMYYPCGGANIAYSPSAFVHSDVCEFHTNHQPWQYLGITRCWLDWSAPAANWSFFREFPYCPLYAPGSGHHFLGAEAIPITDDGAPPYPLDMARVAHVPAIAFHGSISVSNSDKAWDVSSVAGSTELMVVVEHTGDNATYFNVQHMFGVLAWTQRGFVLAGQGPFYPSDECEEITANTLTELFKRVYDFGPLDDARDFNGDGCVNQLDVDDFAAAYNLYKLKSGCNWAHGDVNQDNVVNPQDQLVFNYRRLSANPVPIHLGSAEPLDALTK
ncbi:MAG: hypothetical protein L6Q35_08395 [Phycisphaerales bacterium]|nr:hypothetical protein [Phycisphaerales bacterium]